MTQPQQVELMNAAWFFYTEEGKAMGRLIRKGEDTIPSVGAVITKAPKFGSGEVISFEEMSPTCMMRRYKVVVKIND